MPLIDAPTLLALATRLQQHATALRAGGTDLRHAREAARWNSDAARRFAEQAEKEVRLLIEIGERFEHAASTLRQHVETALARERALAAAAAAAAAEAHRAASGLKDAAVDAARSALESAVPAPLRLVAGVGR